MCIWSYDCSQPTLGYLFSSMPHEVIGKNALHDGGGIYKSVSKSYTKKKKFKMLALLENYEFWEDKGEAANEDKSSIDEANYVADDKNHVFNV